MPFLSKSSDDDERLAHQLSEQVTQLARSDPQFAALLDRSKTGSPLTRLLGGDQSSEIVNYLAQRGITVPQGFTIRALSQGGTPFVQVAAPEHMPGIAPTLVGGIGAAGALGAAGAFGGGGGAAGGGTMAAENVAPFSGLPGGIPASASGASLAGGAAAGAGSSLPGWLDTILKAAPVGAGLVGKLAGGGFGGGNTGPGASPELDELLKLSMQRMRDQEPLFQSVTKQALAGLPTYAQGGK